MLPLGVIYFSIAVLGLFRGLRFALAPLDFLERHFGSFAGLSLGQLRFHGHNVASPHTFVGALFLMILGTVILTFLMHAARSIARAHARLAKVLLVESGG